MKRFIAVMAFGVLILGLGVGISRGQGSTTIQMAQKQIEQGSTLNFDVAVDRAPNLNGNLNFVATPDAGGGELQMACRLNAKQTKCEVSQIVPLDQKLGKWMVTQITFMPLAGTPAKVLTRHGDLSFQIVAHGEVVLPDGATISDIR